MRIQNQVKVVNDWKPLTVYTKYSILDVWLVSQYYSQYSFSMLDSQYFINTFETRVFQKYPENFAFQLFIILQ